VTERDWVDAHLVNAALDIHADDPAFGYRFIADELPEKGITAGENRVQRLCRDHGIWSVFSKKRGLNRKPGPPVHDDLVERDFTAAAANELWLTDITGHPTAEGKLYLCAVKDVYSGRIVGYSMDSRMKSSLAVAALENAVRARRPAGTVVQIRPVPVSPIRRITPAPRAHRIHGQGRRVRGQRRDGDAPISVKRARECFPAVGIGGGRSTSSGSAWLLAWSCRPRFDGRGSSAFRGGFSPARGLRCGGRG
jgi:putative transposase